MRQLVRTDPGEQTERDARALIDDLKVLITAGARIHGTRVHYRFACHGARIMADGVQLQQLILNLVRNAFEALAAQDAHSREIEIATRLVDDQCEISVSDNGPGVQPAIVDRMFDPFCTTKPGGTGLGLAISRTIAQSHGGTIGFREATPAGACFYVRLPLVQGAPS
jgi:two-component system sensor kinase FixL